MMDDRIGSLTTMQGVMGAPGLTDDERAAVRAGNARRLLGLR